MLKSRRVFSGGLLGGALAFVCLTYSEAACGQNRTPVNPLRQPQTIGEELSAKPVERAEPLAAEAVANAKLLERPSAVRPAAYGFETPLRQPAANATRRAANRSQARVVAETKPTPAPTAPIPVPAAPKGTVVPQPAPVEGEIIYDGVIDAFPGELSMLTPDGPECCGGVGCAQCCLIPCPVISFENVEFFAGVNGFTGAANRGGTGSFGFHEGVNWGFPVPCLMGCVAGQVGVRATQSNLSGAEFTDANRHQLFVTGGLFRRVDWGLQGGVVVDYVSQDWYMNTDLVQLRGEASWVFPCTHELGFWFTSGTQTATALSTFTGGAAAARETWEPTDLYAFFYRRHFECFNDAEARFFAGFSGKSDGYIGADAVVPFGPRWGVEAGFAYLIPQESSTGVAGGGHSKEAWNVALSLVWYPGCRTSAGPNYCRPLFPVADNGTFIVGRP